MVMHLGGTSARHVSDDSSNTERGNAELGSAPRTSRLGRSLVLASAVAALVLVAGCREEEQDRILFYDKGVYLGAEDTPLSNDGFQTLRERAQGQHF